MLVVVFVVLAQAIVGMFAIAFNAALAAAGGARLDDPRTIQRLAMHLGGGTLVMSTIITGAIAYLLAIGWARDEMKDRGGSGLGLRIVPARTLALASFAGLLLGGFYVGVVSVLPLRPGFKPGPVAQLVSSGTFDRVALVVVAVVLAPPVEEFLFRGLLLRGFSRSWGVIAGGSFVTILFVLAHAYEFSHFWIAGVAISCLAIVTLVARIRTRSIAPPIFVHASYNLAIFAYVAVAAWLPRFH